MSWNQILQYLATTAVGSHTPQQGTGRPIYPYPLCSMPAEREAALAARRRKNRTKARRRVRRIERARDASSGPSKRFIVPRRDMA